MLSLCDLIEKNGGLGELSRYFGVSHTAIWKWKRNNRIPAHHVLTASKLFNISPQKLRPDIFGKEER